MFKCIPYPMIVSREKVYQLQIGEFRRRNDFFFNLLVFSSLGDVFQAFFVNKREKKLLISTKMIKRPMTYSADYVASLEPLGSISELPADSCREIKASEGDKAVNGRYWLTTPGSHHVSLSYCLMKTGKGKVYRGYRFIFENYFCW